MTGRQRTGEIAPKPFKPGISRIISTDLLARPPLSFLVVQMGKIPGRPHRSSAGFASRVLFGHFSCGIEENPSLVLSQGGCHLDPWLCDNTATRALENPLLSHRCTVDHRCRPAACATPTDTRAYQLGHMLSLGSCLRFFLLRGLWPVTT
ncbi:hypothetical protein J3F83DRAFT_35888 [Trichoderma novae-zelandiae]